MKLNVEIELDWIEEDSSLDEEFQAKLIHGVTSSISEKCLAEVRNKSLESINQTLEKAIEISTQTIDRRTLEFVDEWFEKGIYVTDNWGNVKTKGTIKELLEKRFDDTLSRKVNKSGEFTNGYDSMRLIDYLTGVHVDRIVEERLVNFNREIDKKIESAIKQCIKDKVSDKFAQMVIGVAQEEHAKLNALEQKGT